MPDDTSVYDRASRLQALNDCHTFPGPFVFKVIGENSPEFVLRVRETCTVVLGASAAPSITTRESAQGKHQAVTLVVQVETADLVLEVYQALQSLSGVRFLL